MNIGPDALEDVPIPDDGFERILAAGNRTLRWRRAGLAASCALLAVLLVAGVVALRDPHDARLSTAAPAPSTPSRQPVASAPLLALPSSALAAAPAVPGGWQSVAYGFGQVAVPGDWQPVLNATCFITVPVVFLGDTTFAPDGCAAPNAYLRLSSATNACTDTHVLPLGCRAPRAVNGLTVQVIDPGKCACDTVSYYVTELQLRVDLTNVDAATGDLILSTLAPSAQARVLADGPLADTATWRHTTEHTVGLWTPQQWPTRQLTTSDSSPGTCGGNPLSNFRETVIVGWGGVPSSCPPVSKPWPQAHVNGVWIPSPAPWTTEPTQEEIIDVAGRQVRVGAPAGADFLVLRIQGDHNRQATVTVGIGPDLSVARAIVRSITVNGQPLAATKPTPTATGVPPPSPDDLKAADDQLRQQQANGWVPYAGDPLIAGDNVPNPAWVAAGADGQPLADVSAARPDCARPPQIPEPVQFICVHDSPNGKLVGYHVSNGGYVAAGRLDAIEVKKALAERLQRLLDSGTPLPPDDRAATEQRIKDLQNPGTPPTVSPDTPTSPVRAQFDVLHTAPLNLDQPVSLWVYTPADADPPPGPDSQLAAGNWRRMFQQVTVRSLDGTAPAHDGLSTTSLGVDVPPIAAQWLNSLPTGSIVAAKPADPPPCADPGQQPARCEPEPR